MTRAPIASRWCRRVGVAVAAVVLSLLISSGPAVAQDPPNSDFDVDFLDLLFVDANGAALGTGGSQTAFTIELEGDDQCPGDSTHDGYRVDSYMVPMAVDPTELDFNGFGPNPPVYERYDGFQMPLIPINGNGFAAELAGDAFEAGGPGPIRDLPGFDFTSYVSGPSTPDWAGGVPVGAYRVGIACTFNGRMTNAWETTMDVVADPADAPVGMRWTITGPQPLDLETSSSDGTSKFVAGLVGFAVVAAVAAFLLGRSARSDDQEPDTPPIESPRERVP